MSPIPIGMLAFKSGFPTQPSPFFFFFFLAELETDSERAGASLSSPSPWASRSGVLTTGFQGLGICPYHQLDGSVLSRLARERKRGDGVWLCRERDSDLSGLEFPPFWSGAGSPVKGWLVSRAEPWGDRELELRPFPP